MHSPSASIAARFGENLARTRKRAQLSQEEVGVMASLHRTEISLLERGTRLPRIDTAIKLAGALEVELALPPETPVKPELRAAQTAS